MRDGKMVSIGGRDEILAAFLRQVASGAVPPGAAGSPFTATAGPPPAGAGAKPARSADKPIVEASFG
jgi:hypothetical protein